MRKLAFVFVWILVFAVPWENTVQIPGVGTISRFLGLVAAPVGLMAVVWERRFREPGACLVAITLFVCWGVASYFWSFSPELSAIACMTYLQLLAFVWLLWEFGRTDQDRLNLMGAYVLGAYVSVVGTFYATFTGEQVDYHRYAASGFEPGELGLILALAIPMSWYLATLELSRFRTALYRLYVPLACIAIACTASRQSFLSMTVALTFVLGTYRKLHLGLKFSLCVLVGVAAYAAVQFVPATSWTRLSTLPAEMTSGTLNGRTDVWKAGFDLFAAHPVAGIGAGAFRVGVEPALGYEIAAHNTFLCVLTEQGLIGFTLFFIVLITALASTRRIDVLSRRLWLTLFLVWAVGVCAVTWNYRKPTWLLIGLLAAHSVSVQRREFLPRTIRPCTAPIAT